MVYRCVSPFLTENGIYAEYITGHQDGIIQ